MATPQKPVARTTQVTKAAVPSPKRSADQHEGGQNVPPHKRPNTSSEDGSDGTYQDDLQSNQDGEGYDDTQRDDADDPVPQTQHNQPQNRANGGVPPPTHTVPRNSDFPS